MPFIVGVVLAAAVGLFARVVGFDRERSFYPTVLIVIAVLYILFAAIAESTAAMAAEAIPALLFGSAAVAGFRRSPWIVAAGLALHGVFDLVHPAVIANPGVPAWWPGFCGGYDIAAGAGLAMVILTRPAAERGVNVVR